VDGRWVLALSDVNGKGHLEEVKIMEEVVFR
jgi:hypothetical protein